MALAVLLAGIAGLRPTAAEDAPPPAPSPPPAAPVRPLAKSTAQAADEVLVAWGADDDAALRTLAAQDTPDPWFVADELLRRAAPDAAAAFAKAAPRPDTESLPAYVASRRDRPDDPARRDRLATAVRLLQEGEAEAALRALGPAEEAGGDVGAVRHAWLRAEALAGRGPPGDEELAWARAATLAAQVGWTRVEGLSSRRGASAALRAGHLPFAHRAAQRAIELAQRRSDQQGEIQAELNLAAVLYEQGEIAAAGERFRALAPRFAAVGDGRNEAICLSNAASVQATMGDFEGARRSFLASADAHRRVGSTGEAVQARIHVAQIDIELGRPGDALAVLAAVRSEVARLDAPRRLQFLSVEARALHMIGDYGPALARFEEVRAGWAALGHDVNAAMALANAGAVHGSRGDLSQALDAQERSIPQLRRARPLADTWGLQANAARTLADLGDPAEGERRLVALLAELEAISAAVPAAQVRVHLSELLAAGGRIQEALAMVGPAAKTLEASGALAFAAEALRAIASLERTAGRADDALSTLDRVQALCRTVGDSIGAAQAEVARARLLAERGEVADARARLASVRATFEEAGDGANAAAVDGEVAAIEFRAGRPAASIAAALRMADWAAAATEGLGEVQGAEGRSKVASGVELGLSAAAALGDADAAIRLIEMLRARGLLDALRARETLRENLVTSELRGEESVARGRVARAQAELGAALARGDREEARRARGTLDDAQREFLAVVERIRGASRRGSDLVLPRPAETAAIRASLAPHEALVLYASRSPAAVVVRPDGARVVALGSVGEIAAAVDALEILDTAGGDPAAVARARRALVDPLGLEKDVQRVLLCPDGVLTQVPFALLLPDHAVAYVPSASTYVLLRDEASLRGNGVLALGDPDYAPRSEAQAGLALRGRSQRLARLPSTRDEVMAVGTVRLLGEEATEARLREALAPNRRWRALHLACHGLVDRERPTLSSLAITASGDDDGDLTCLDVFRLRIPADLVVLSACETARGRVVHGEGLVGFARAFMFAGSPRVLCSLWKVDDAATAALMRAFYELWNPAPGQPGLPPAEALRRAQEIVRTQEKWRHPYYWAAWVLWGLPS